MTVKQEFLIDIICVDNSKPCQVRNGAEIRCFWKMQEQDGSLRS